MKEYFTFYVVRGRQTDKNQQPRLTKYISHVKMDEITFCTKISDALRCESIQQANGLHKLFLKNQFENVETIEVTCGLISAKPIQNHNEGFNE